MTSSQIATLVDQSVSSQAVADRLIRLMWRAEHQALSHLRTNLERQISDCSHMMSWLGRMALSEDEQEAYRTLLASAVAQLPTIKARLAALRPLVHRYHTHDLI